MMMMMRRRQSLSSTPSLPYCGLLIALLLMTYGRLVRAEKRCDQAKLKSCQARYEHCKEFESPSMDKQLTLCKCAKLYYGVCLRQAGCAVEFMMPCVNEMLALNCDDMTVCGNNCASQAPEDPIILPVNNFGSNYLKFGFCNSTALDLKYLALYSTVRITKCVAGSFTMCDYWVPPHTYTALAIPRNSVFLDMWECNYYKNADGTTYSNCLDQYKEFYGQPKLWPSTIDVDFSHAPRCNTDLDCPGSFCDFHQVPAICSPKDEAQLIGGAATFYEASV